MADENDILNQVQTVFNANLTTLKSTEPISNVEKIPNVKMISVKYGFPAAGILDGGENTDSGASVSLVTEIVIIAVYVKVLGDQEKCMDEAREIVKNCITELRKKEHYRTGGAFSGYSRASCPKISEIKTVYTADDLNPVLLKLARIEFKKQEVQN
jgi:hypothetical protein